MGYAPLPVDRDYYDFRQYIIEAEAALDQANAFAKMYHGIISSESTNGE